MARHRNLRNMKPLKQTRSLVSVKAAPASPHEQHCICVTGGASVRHLIDGWDSAVGSGWAGPGGVHNETDDDDKRRLNASATLVIHLSGAIFVTHLTTLVFTCVSSCHLLLAFFCRHPQMYRNTLKTNALCQRQGQGHLILLSLSKVT